MSDATFIRNSIEEIHKKIQKQMRTELIKYDITLPQAKVIMYLLQYEKATVTTLSQKLNVSQSTISGIIDRLVTKKIIIKKTCSNDHRLQYLKVAPAIKDFYLTNQNKLLNESLEKIVSELKEEDLLTIKQGLKLLLRSLDAFDESN